MKINKAIITAAGFGSRFLPITQTIQKEMLPIINRPLIDYVVEDCINAGIEEIIFVVNEHSDQIVNFYKENKKIHYYLDKFHKDGLKSKIPYQHTRANFEFVFQTDEDQYGTAVPVKLVADHVKNEDAFLVLMGDDFIYNSNRKSEIQMMIERFIRTRASGLMTCVTRPNDLLHKYGIAEITTENEENYLKNIIEKPAPGTAPSNLSNISKYIFTPEIIDIIQDQKADINSGELLITDSILTLLQTQKVVIHQPSGTYLDGGYPLGWLMANLTVAKDREDIYPELREFIEKTWLD